MVKIERTPTPPPSLAKRISYREPDVIDQLHHDFHSKCYLCELDHLTDIRVEHLLPHYNGRYPDRKFDWNNLFLSCPHCNSMKGAKYDGKLIDCCKEDPELLLDHTIEDKRVVVKTHRPDESREDVRMTAELITACFENRNTGIRTFECQERVDRLMSTMDTLNKVLLRYRKNKASKKYTAVLRSMLRLDAPFAAFTRYYVRSHLDTYPGLEPFLR